MARYLFRNHNLPESEIVKESPNKQEEQPAAKRSRIDTPLLRE